MAVDRPSIDGYGSSDAATSTPGLASYSRERRPSDGLPKTSHHDYHHHQHPTASTHAHSREAGGHHHHQQQQQQRRSSLPEVDREAFSMLREQVSYNYQCIQQDREAITRFDTHLGQFESTITRMLDDFRHELAARGVSGASPSAGSQHTRADHGDIDVLANQIATVTTKANEIDNLKVQLELLKTKIRRLEQDNQIPPPHRPTSAASHRDGTHDNSQHHSQYHHNGHTHHQLPPIQTGAPASPSHSRNQPSKYHAQSGYADTAYQAHREQRQSPGELQSHPSGPTKHRHQGSAPPPPGWRSAAGVTPLTPHPSTGSVRSAPHDPDSQSQSWASVNGLQMKRSYEDGVLPEYSAPTSPKRPKLAPLAPLKPRLSPGEDTPPSYAPHQGPPEPYAINTRLPHHDRPPPQLLTTPASANGPAPSSAYKFVATTPLDGPDNWRDSENGSTPTSSRGRGRGRGRGMRMRGGRDNGSGRDSQEYATSEWDQKSAGEWHAPSAQHQLSPNGYHGPHRPPSARAAMGEAPQQDYPLTPIASAISPGEHTVLGPDGIAGNKKTRTKPVRNADGILIRKDGRPDMRSVSSANNLRKVHAKKEAERAETDGRTPVSARELAPAGQNSANSDEEGDDAVEHINGTSRSGTPKAHTNGHRDPDATGLQRDRSASDGEEKKARFEHRWISSKYEREGELRDTRRTLDNGVSQGEAGLTKSADQLASTDGHHDGNAIAGEVKAG